MARYVWIATLCILVAGCRQTHWAEIRDRPSNPLAATFQFDSSGGAQPTPRTMQFLRAQDLVPVLDRDPVELLGLVQKIALAEPSSSNVYAVAEIAYVGAKRLDAAGQHERAVDLYGAAMANAYFYLFDPELQRQRNPYDPRFRLAADIYNTALEASMRHLRHRQSLKPGGQFLIQTPYQDIEIRIAERDTWHEQHFQDLKFVSDFSVKELKNHYHTYGLGTPMIAVYAPTRIPDLGDQFYPPGMSFPVTAVLKVVHTQHSGSGRTLHRCVLELHDPLVSAELVIGHHAVPLETDLTTPLAYSLDNPVFKAANEPIRGLRQPERSLQDSGLYMLEPYHPDKIPVVMIHGFWSSLVTWMEMFNDLRGDASIRDRFQFWFYLYPSGQPFWYSAADLRRELAYARQRLDPAHRQEGLDQMILVGHSMGGLIARLQTLDSGDRFWKLNSESPLETLELEPDVEQALHETFFFSPNPSVRRVVTIATPHCGSQFSNQATQWLGGKFIELPYQLTSARNLLLSNNPNSLLPNAPVLGGTNVEAMAPTSPFLLAMQQAPPAPWVHYHAIVGSIDGDPNGSDGIVDVASARLPGAESELLVVGEHTKVHRVPASIRELRRILLLHAAQVGAEGGSPPTQSVTAATGSLAGPDNGREG